MRWQGWWECEVCRDGVYEMFRDGGSVRCAGMVGVYEMCRDGGSVRCAGMVGVYEMCRDGGSV